MPLTRLKDEYLEQDGVRFLMEDQDGSTVACRVSHEALRDHADRLHFSGTDGAVFEAYRELIEQVASDAYDAEGPFDDNGRVLVTPEALARVTRSAYKPNPNVLCLVRRDAPQERERPSRRGQQPNADLDALPNVRYWG